MFLPGAFPKDFGWLDRIQFERESAVPQYCRPAPKANWKVGLKGACDSGLGVSTSIHCREPGQRQKEIPGWGSKANRHLSALGNSSIDRDTNSSIHSARTYTDSHTHGGANEVQNKRLLHLEKSASTVTACCQITNCTQPTAVSISMIKSPRNSRVNGGFWEERKGTRDGEWQKRGGQTSSDNQLGSSGNFHLPLKILICVSATLPIDASN